MAASDKRAVTRFCLCLRGAAKAADRRPGHCFQTEVVSRNFSTRGAHFLAAACPAAGDPLEFRLSWPPVTTLVGLGTVVRSQQLSTGTYDFALQFVQSPWGVRLINEEIFRYWDQLGRVRRYVLEKTAEGMSLKHAAEIACMEPSYFSAFFHKKTGVCFHEWLRGIRIEKALGPLMGGDSSVTGAALVAGYRNVRTFERAFRTVFKVGPRNFKQAILTCVPKVGGDAPFDTPVR